ncbi:magnesium transporter [Yersinia kristensenii]|uniref:magnesium transporter n=1 Tax=Yersinia kristensenii TaxID=28152 RepID=UPI0005E541AC|nr:magnesium transporter [Yersinia kristensenii]CFR24365.1 MgtE integral membrane protein [Yersinia kristensenii]
MSSHIDLALQKQDQFHPGEDKECTLGAYMSDAYVTVSADMSVAEAKTYFLQNISDDEIPTQLLVINDNQHLLGLLSVKKLLTEEQQDIKIFQIINQNYFSVSPDQNRHEAVSLLSKNSLGIIPVLSHGKLMGILRAQDVAELIEDENTDDAQRQGASFPLDEPYLQTSPVTLWRKRVVWLLLLFVAEAYTGTVLKAFEEQLEAAIALAFFIPLLIGTGGNSGTQITSTLVRAMALGEVSLRNIGAVLRKEVSTSLMVAATIGLAAWVRAWFLGVGMEVTIVVSLTVVAITVWSAIISSIIPMVLKRLSIDPAVVSAPFIATFIDGTGLIIYFEIAQRVMTDLA